MSVEDIDWNEDMTPNLVKVINQDTTCRSHAQKAKDPVLPISLHLRDF